MDASMTEEPRLTESCAAFVPRMPVREEGHQSLLFPLTAGAHTDVRHPVELFEAP